MKYLPNERGSVPVLLIILVLALVAVAGVAVYNFNKTHQKTAATSSPAVSTSPVATLSPNASNVVKLNDWGVKVQLESSLANTKVVYNKQTTNDQPPQSYYAFTTSRVEALGGNCASTALQFGDIAILERFSGKPVATPDGELLNSTPINGYYYVLTSPSASCSGMGVRPENTIETQDRAALKSSLETLSAISN